MNQRIKAIHGLSEPPTILTLEEFADHFGCDLVWQVHSSIYDPFLSVEASCWLEGLDVEGSITRAFGVEGYVSCGTFHLSDAYIAGFSAFLKELSRAYNANPCGPWRTISIRLENSNMVFVREAFVNLGILRWDLCGRYSRIKAITP